MTFVVVFVERGQRKILVNYAKRQVGNKDLRWTNQSHLPLKLNMAGVIPTDLRFVDYLVPGNDRGLVHQGQADTANPVVRLPERFGSIDGCQASLSTHCCTPLAIVFFCFFYTALVFNSKETADNLKKSGAFVPGIRPGEQTARYIDKILTRLTLAGAIYITLVCLLPEFMQAEWKVPFYFGGTSLLIIVVVTMDFMAQVQNYVMSQQYESLLRKANFKGGIPTR